MMKQDHNTEEWVISLSVIALAMNQSVRGSTKMMPYEVVFGQKPRWGDNALVSPGGRKIHTGGYC